MRYKNTFGLPSATGREDNIRNCRPVTGARDVAVRVFLKDIVVYVDRMEEFKGRQRVLLLEQKVRDANSRSRFSQNRMNLSGWALRSYWNVTGADFENSKDGDIEVYRLVHQDHNQVPGFHSLIHKVMRQTIPQLV